MEVALATNKDMEYEGKLYGKVGNTYLPLIETTFDFEALKEKVKELEAENTKLRASQRITIFPQTEDEIRAYALLEQISKVKILPPAPYGPENDIRKSNIKRWTEEYFSIIHKINH